MTTTEMVLIPEPVTADLGAALVAAAQRKRAGALKTLWQLADSQLAGKPLAAKDVDALQDVMTVLDVHGDQLQAMTAALRRYRDAQAQVRTVSEHQRLAGLAVARLVKAREALRVAMEAPQRAVREAEDAARAADVALGNASRASSGLPSLWRAMVLPADRKRLDAIDAETRALELELTRLASVLRFAHENITEGRRWLASSEGRGHNFLPRVRRTKESIAKSETDVVVVEGQIRELRDQLAALAGQATSVASGYPQ